MSRRLRHLIYTAIAFALLASLWLLSSEPWGLGVYELLVFTAPGALLGLGAGWASHALARSSFTWDRARRSAVLGAVTLPPVLAFIVALDGSGQPQRLLTGFVYSAWIALAGGGIAAMVGDAHKGAR